MTYPTTNPVAKELADFWQSSQSQQQQWWAEADIDTKMAAGQQDYMNRYYNGGFTRNQKQLQFNKILRVLNMIDGFQRDNRLQNIMVAADNDQDEGETAEQRTTVNNWVCNRDNIYEKISDCFGGSNICGLNLLHLWMDFREDPESGDIKAERLPFSAFLMDNYWSKQDLSDCDRIWTRKYITGPQLIGIFPDLKNELPYLGKGYAAKDGKFQYLAQNWYQYTQDYYAYDEYWTKDWKKTRKLMDSSTGEVVDWRGTKDQFMLMKRYNPNIQVITATVPTIKLRILVNNRLVYEEQSPYGLDKFPFVPFICYHFPEVQEYSYRYQGIVRNIRDSQVELNRRRNVLLDILDSQAQSGLMMKEDALVNPEDAFQQGPGKILFFKNTANLATDVMPRPMPPVAPGWEELIMSIEREITEIVGPEELFGQNLGAKEMTGVLLKLKQGSGLVGLRNIFDRLNLSQKMVGELIDDMIVNNFSKGKVQNIIGKEITPFFFDNSFSKYKCTVEEAELTSTQRQFKFLQALQMKQILPDAIPDDYLLESSSLQDKKKLIEMAKQRIQQAQQMQEAQNQQAMQQQAVLTRSLEAKAQSDFAGAEERKARAVTDMALAKKDAAMAVHDRAKANLDNAKALKELEEMDENRLMKLAKFMLELQERQRTLQGGEELDAASNAQSIGSEPKQAEQETKVKRPA